MDWFIKYLLFFNLNEIYLTLNDIDQQEDKNKALSDPVHSWLYKTRGIIKNISTIKIDT